MPSLEQRFNELGYFFSILNIAILTFLTVMILEAIWDIFYKRSRSIHQTGANISIAIVQAGLEYIGYGLIFLIGLFLFEGFALFDIAVNWKTWILSLLLADFSYYWMHRFEHQIRVLWTYHSVHHSSPEFNFSTSLRLAWIEGAVEWVFFLPMILIGFDLVQTIMSLLCVIAYQSWIHTEKIGKLGWLDYIFNTPSVHRVHHGTNPEYIDKNYGGILIIWDRIFGTYQAETKKVIYGVTEPVKTINPFLINIYELREMLRDIRKAKRMRAKLKYIFSQPGWRENDRGLK